MRCFAHPGREASAVCNKCGKAMCTNCSAYSNHSGTCPACRRDEFLNNVSSLTSQIAELDRQKINRIIIGVVILILSVITAIKVSPGMIVGIVAPVGLGISLVSLQKRIKSLQDSKTFYLGEIRKIDDALSRGDAEI